MKIPYVKIYTADLLAKARKLSPEQIGRAVVGVCEQAFENQTDYTPQTEPEQAFFNLLMEWKQESIAALKQKRSAGRNGAKKKRKKKNFQTVAPPFYLLMADRYRNRYRVI